MKSLLYTLLFLTIFLSSLSGQINNSKDIYTNLAEIPTQFSLNGDEISFDIDLRKELSKSNEKVNISIEILPEYKDIVRGELNISKVGEHYFSLNYLPNRMDINPFKALITINRGLRKSITDTIDFVPIRKFQESTSLIKNNQKQPDETSSEYVSIVKNTIEHKGEFNWVETKELLEFIITGRDIIIEREHSNGIYDILSKNNKNIKTLRLFAERIEVRTPIVLHETDIFINAKELEFKDNGEEISSITTTPIPGKRARKDDPIPYTKGLKAGNITATIDTLIVNEVDTFRFNLVGGKGMDAKKGNHGNVSRVMPNLRQKGGYRISVSLWTGEQYVTQGRYAFPHDNTIAYYSKMNDINNKYWHTTKWGTLDFNQYRGTPATPGGFPGAPGDGGSLKITSSHELSKIQTISNLNVGEMGNPDPEKDYSGGPPAYTGLVYYFKFEGNITEYKQGKGNFWKSTKLPRGIDAKSPQEPHGSQKWNNGIPSANQFDDTNRYSWVSSLWLDKGVLYIRDLYRLGYYDLASKEMIKYSNLLDECMESEYWNSPSQLQERRKLIKIQDEINGLLLQLDNNLDYYGNPPNWVPLLSFNTNYSNFNVEVTNTFENLYMIAWLQAEDKKISTKISALEGFKNNNKADIKNLIEKLKTAEDDLSEVEYLARNVTNQHEVVSTQIKTLTERFLKQAKKKTAPKKWQKLLKLAGGLAQVIPFGQPILATLGKAAELYNPDSPEDILKNVSDISKTYKQAKTYKTNYEKFFGVVEGAKFDNSENIEKAVKDISNAAKPMGDYLKVSSKNIKKSYNEYQETQKVPKNKVEAELERLKKNSPEFQKLSQELKKLISLKEEYQVKLTELNELVVTIPNDIQTKTLGINDINNQLYEYDKSNPFNMPEVTNYLVKMKKENLDRLNKYHYYLAKSFEYRYLEPYVGNLQIDAIFTKVEEYVSKSLMFSTEGKDKFATLKDFYLIELDRVTDKIVDYYQKNSVKSEIPTTYNLSRRELDKLNSNGEILINFKKAGIKKSDYEDVRIVSVKPILKHTKIDTTGAVNASIANVFISSQYEGISKFNKDGKNYKFSHYASESKNPIFWEIIHDINTDETSESKTSIRDAYLWQNLLNRGTNISNLKSNERQSVRNLNVYPSIDSEFKIKKSSSEGSRNYAIEKLILEVNIEYAIERNDDIVEYTFNYKGTNIPPSIVFNKDDKYGRGGSSGWFNRFYNNNRDIELISELENDDSLFSHWENSAGEQISDNAILVLNPDIAKSVVAVYVDKL